MKDGWKSIPIIRLDQTQTSGVEIVELSDEDQTEPLDLTQTLTVEGVVTSPSDEESNADTIEIEEVHDDEPLDLSKKHKPLSNESSISSSSSVITVIEVPKPVGAEDGGSVKAESSQEKVDPSKGSETENRWSVNIPIIKLDQKDEKSPAKKPEQKEDRWSVNIPITRVKDKAERDTEDIPNTINKEGKDQGVRGLRKLLNSDTEGPTCEDADISIEENDNDILWDVTRLGTLVSMPRQNTGLDTIVE